MLMNGSIASTEEDRENRENRLISQVFTSYNKLYRPADKETGEVEVSFGISLMSIDEYDLASEKMTIDVRENYVSKYKLCIICSITMIQMFNNSPKALALCSIIINW